MNEASSSASVRLGWQRNTTADFLRAIWVPLLAVLVSVAASQVHYLLFHTTAEFISIVIAMTALVVSTTSRTFTRNHFVVYVAVVMGWSAVMDFFHVLAYQGMGLLDAVVSPDHYPGTQTWILARYLQASALMLSPLFLARSFRVIYLHLVLLVAVVLSLAWVISGTFPTVFVPGQGLTPFKVYSEYVIILMLATTMVLLWRQRQKTTPAVLFNIEIALGLMILTEFSFTVYVSMYGRANEVGHILKIFSAWFVYQALIQRTLIDPFSMLSRTATSYDAVPFPALVVNREGTVVQANRAAARFSGVSAEALVGLSAHDTFHDASRGAGDCPVCQRLAQGESAFSLELTVPASGRSLACTVAPFVEGAGPRGHHVQVLQDITDRKHLETERETLLFNLNERVKEVRTQYVVSEILGKPDLDIPAMLQQVATVLPQGFLVPAQARVSIASDWGNFGSEGDAQAAFSLRCPLRVAQKVAGEIRVVYAPALTKAGDPFLPEERDMIETVAQRVGSVIERLQTGKQVKRLSYLYNMLSATNRAIVHCRTPQELLQRVFDALIQHGAFPMLYIAMKEGDAASWRVVHAHGIADERVTQLQTLLADAQGPMALLWAALNQGRVVWSPIATGGVHASWLDYLAQHGVVERAVMPLRREGRLIGCIALLPVGAGAFDQAQINLLQEMAEDLAFAFDSMAQTERRQVAESRAAFSELRFQEVFDASPAPMQIISLTTGDMRAINRAHQQWLGYELTDIASSERWMAQVYPDPTVRAALVQDWMQSIQQARDSGRSVQSPELRLRCKDGSERIAVGTMSLVGDDTIVAWTDLTEIRRSEDALRASEAHFRTMIEQAVVGIYVRREGRFIYVNPRYCEMLGWSRDELEGQEIWSFTEKTPGNIELIHRAWQRLDAGEDRVEYTVPVRHKNGQMLELQLTARTILWDERPATIVMATDVTERKRTESQIANYVQQLEASRRGTLQAVSNMIDRRDPYTAGHERRVGLIAGAIARELGWDMHRCEMMELTGLVHDIGKIAIPAEILSKPGRLSPLEMDLVRGHAQAGYDILKDVPFDFPVAEIIYQHHERIDGSGYPRGLRGDAILPEARVLTVADVLESMAAHRPYRPALGLDAALDELERGRGSLYDPAVVDAIQRMIRDNAYVLPQ